MIGSARLSATLPGSVNRAPWCSAYVGGDFLNVTESGLQVQRWRVSTVRCNRFPSVRNEHVYSLFIDLTRDESLESLQVPVRTELIHHIRRILESDDSPPLISPIHHREWHGIGYFRKCLTFAYHRTLEVNNSYVTSQEAYLLHVHLKRCIGVKLIKNEFVPKGDLLSS